jgi:hypothetical protein
VAAVEEVKVSTKQQVTVIRALEVEEEPILVLQM